MVNEAIAIILISKTGGANAGRYMAVYIVFNIFAASTL